MNSSKDDEMKLPSPPRLKFRRNCAIPNGNNNDSNHGTASDGNRNNNNGTHDDLNSLRRQGSSATRKSATKFIAVAALSFIVGIAFTNPTATHMQSSAENGFEAPTASTDVKRRRPRIEQTRANSQQTHVNNSYQYRQAPRIIGLQITPHQTLAYRVPYSTTSFSTDALPEGYAITPDWYEANAVKFMDGHDFSKCVPMEKWQLESFVNCNKFHELDLKQMRMINRGGSRIAFELNQNLPSSTTTFKFVYKSMRYGKEVDEYQIEQQRKDALVMERTTSSKFIPSIHGYCSLAVMMDFMPEGNMHDYIKGSRILSRKLNGAHGVEDASGKLLNSVDRLKIGIHIATSVADLHGIDGTKKPSYFHNDLCCHQYLFQDGLFKLNDFNYARPIYIDKNTKEQCTRYSYGMIHWKARSLEEHIMALKLPLDPPVPDKIDVWMMGNIIYYILTDLYTFERPENLKNREVGQLLVAGKRSPYPEYIEKSTDPAHIAMKEALDMCWTQNWRERPSAREISDYMLGELRNITGEDDPDLRVVLPERDPNQKPSDGEYNAFND